MPKDSQNICDELKSTVVCHVACGPCCTSVATFLSWFLYCGNKIPKTTEIFDDVDYSKSQGVTYWDERIELLVDHISQVSCCAVFGTIQKNHMLFFEYFKIGCMYLDLKKLIWKVWSGARLVTISCIVISITAFSVTKKPMKNWRRKNQTELWQH